MWAGRGGFLEPLGELLPSQGAAKGFLPGEPPPPFQSPGTQDSLGSREALLHLNLARYRLFPVHSQPSPSLQLKHSLKKKKKNLNDAKGFLRFNSPHSPIYFEGVDNICKGIKSQNPVSLKFVFSSYSFVFLCAFTNVTWPAWGQALRTPPSGTSASSPKPLGPRR